MPVQKIVFVSSNRIWAGSEVLWAAAVRELSGKDVAVLAAVSYDYRFLEKYIDRNSYLDLRPSVSMPTSLMRLMRRLRLLKFNPKAPFPRMLENEKPDLVIISQGNNSDGRQFMKACNEYSVPYITLTHLVTEGLWPGLTDDMMDELRTLYNSARVNYFVSRATLNLHEKILGWSFPNSELVYNPFRGSKDLPPDYPAVIDNTYRLALVGRIEMFHKGYDILIDVVRQEKWRSRRIEFSIYGSGPHERLLKRMIGKHELTNIHVFDHAEDLETIWSGHHMLFMPSRMEGQALALIEAMRYGRPALVTHVGGTTELIQESYSGFIAAYPTIEHVDEALERAWQKREEWKQMGVNAREAIRSKHPEDAVHYFTEKILTILKRSAPAAGSD